METNRTLQLASFYLDGQAKLSRCCMYQPLNNWYKPSKNRD